MYESRVQVEVERAEARGLRVQVEVEGAEARGRGYHVGCSFHVT